MISLELQNVICDAYRIFARYGLQDDFAVCACCGCLPDWEQQALLATPVRKITAEQMRSYLSALAWCEAGGNAAAIRASKRFLPRILELAAERAELSAIGEEFTFSRLQFSREDYWTAAEREFIARYALAFFTDELARETNGLVSAVNWLIAFALAELPIALLLVLWREKAQEDAALWHFVEMMRGIFVDEDFVFTCNYLEEIPAVCAEITAWLQAADTKHAFLQGAEWMIAGGQYQDGSLYYLQWLCDILRK